MASQGETPERPGWRCLHDVWLRTETSSQALHLFADMAVKVHSCAEIHSQLINPARPKNPCGLMIRTTAISAKIETLAISGANSDVMLTTTPTRRPASTAPPIDPMPPTTVTTNTSPRTVPPISAITPQLHAPSHPPNPPPAPPIPNTINHTLDTSTPTT